VNQQQKDTYNPMANLFITTQDKIIDLDHVIAIEIANLFDDIYQVTYHLTTGVIFHSRCSTDETASREKWAAFQQMKTGRSIEEDKCKD
jgi:hypothetical protein